MMPTTMVDEAQVRRWRVISSERVVDAEIMADE